MSAIGTKQTCRVAPHMSAIGGKADMTFRAAHVVRLRPKADIAEKGYGQTVYPPSYIMQRT